MTSEPCESAIKWSFTEYLEPFQRAMRQRIEQMTNKIDINQEYETRDGRPVRLYATDAGGTYTVHGAVWDEQMEQWEPESWNEFGAFSSSGENQEWDLVPARKIRDLTMADLAEIVPDWARVSFVSEESRIFVANRNETVGYGFPLDDSASQLREVFEKKLLQPE